MHSFSVGYVSANYYYLAEEVGLDKMQIYELCCNGFRAAFIGEPERQQYLNRLKSAYDST